MGRRQLAALRGPVERGTVAGPGRRRLLLSRTGLIGRAG